MHDAERYTGDLGEEKRDEGGMVTGVSRAWCLSCTSKHSVSPSLLLPTPPSSHPLFFQRGGEGGERLHCDGIKNTDETQRKKSGEKPRRPTATCWGTAKMTTFGVHLRKMRINFSSIMCLMSLKTDFM